MDEKQIRLTLEENDSDSNYDDENNSDFEDHVEMRLKSNPEQEEDSDSEVEDRRTSSVYYLGKNNQTKWNKTAEIFLYMEHAIMVCPDCYGGPDRWIRGKLNYSFLLFI